MVKRPVIIFDMDGVLVDSIPFHYKSLRKLFAGYGIKYSFDEYKRHDITAGAMNVIPRVFRAHGGNPANIQDALKKKNRLSLNVQIPLFPGVLELIKNLKKKGYTLAVASGGTRYFVTRRLKKNRIYKYFDFIITGDDHVRKKPHPGIYLKTAKEFKVHPADCVVIEDSYDGVLAAKRAGMKVIGHKVPIEEQDLSRADFAVDSMTDINLKLILKVWKKE